MLLTETFLPLKLFILIKDEIIKFTIERFEKDQTL